MKLIIILLLTGCTLVSTVRGRVYIAPTENPTEFEPVKNAKIFFSTEKFIINNGGSFDQKFLDRVKDYSPEKIEFSKGYSIINSNGCYYYNTGIPDAGYIIFYKVIYENEAHYGYLPITTYKNNYFNLFLKKEGDEDFKKNIIFKKEKDNECDFDKSEREFMRYSEHDSSGK